ncbi:MAG: hypothetical protein J6U23_12760 [Clostridiales bacterium]|nr:hypothetical protein [Clostridiales bacterium]MBP5417652.1 hypothetical protein [Clostridiales bacterium]
MKNTWDKIVMDEDKKEEIRKALLKKKPVTHTWIKVVAAAAALICAVMIIPFTRNKVLQAAERIIKPFRTKNGLEMDIEYDDNNDFVSATVVGTPTEYLKVVNGRLIFEIEDKTIDVTDLCSDEDFYRYEIKNDDGSINLIYVGGNITHYGWFEVVISSDFQENTNEDNVNVLWYIYGHNSEYVENPSEAEQKWAQKAEEDAKKYMSSMK